MGLAATWRRQGAWAAAATFLVPGVLFLALVGGGVPALRALGPGGTRPQGPRGRPRARRAGPGRPRPAGPRGAPRRVHGAGPPSRRAPAHGAGPAARAGHPRP